MGKDYTKYKADELLNDDYFLLSELYPTEKDRKFWNQLQQADSVLAGEIESARLFLKDIKRISNNPILLVDEEKELWKRIQITNALYDKHKKSECAGTWRIRSYFFGHMETCAKSSA